MRRTAPCPGCDQPISVIAAIPSVREGVVVLLCPRCAEAPEIPAAPAPTPNPAPAPAPAPAPRARRQIDLQDITGEIDLATAEDERPPRRLRWKRPLAAIAALAVLTVIGVQVKSSIIKSHRAPKAAAVRTPEPLSRVSFAPSEPPTLHALSVAFSDEEAALPWIHPISGERQLPDKDDRRFGAPRPGERPGECGAGHCGVDLGGGLGAVVHAALGGKLIRVKSDAAGASGRYVAIEHPQGLRSHYMHLDRVHPGLVEGVEIASGEAIGTLGKTGVHNSPPHLHFTVEKLIDGAWRYVDPEPMLVQATILDTDAPIPDPPILAVDIRNSSIVRKAPAASPPSVGTPAKRAPLTAAKPAASSQPSEKKPSPKAQTPTASPLDARSTAESPKPPADSPAPPKKAPADSTKAPPTKPSAGSPPADSTKAPPTNAPAGSPATDSTKAPPDATGEAARTPPSATMR